MAWLAVLIFIHPVPGTIAFRNLWLLAGFVVLLWRHRSSFPITLPRPWRPVAWAFAALSGWLVLHSAFLAPSATDALSQVRANWINPLLVGTLCCWAASQLSRERALQAVSLSLAAHLVWLLLHQLQRFLFSGAWPFKTTPFGGYDYHGMLISFLVALVVADRAHFLWHKHSPLGVGRTWGWGLLALCLLADAALQSRNSTAIDIALLVAAGMVLVMSASARIKTASLVLALVALPLVATLQFDTRWSGLIESAQIGWSSPSTYWLTADPATRPLAPSGQALEESAYLRAAWARQAMDHLATHPLGIGFGHEAFGRAVQASHGHAGFGSSHSGWLDFALGVGWPGLALLLLTGIVAVAAGYRVTLQAGNGAGLLASFFIGGYLLRGLLDGHLTGWRLSLFAAILGVLLSCLNTRRTAP